MESEPIRIGVIGPGGEATRPGCARGQYLMDTYLKIPGISVTAVCDVVESNVRETIDKARAVQGFAPEAYASGPEGYKRLLERDDVDAVIITAPAQLHARMAIDAMNAGKHVGSEVPGGYEPDELWELVETRERTGRCYMLLENYVYRRSDLAILNMIASGALGEPYYADCGYVHEIKWIAYHDDGRPTWRIDWYTTMRGNSYPTHAIGPVAKWLGINDGDRFESCTAMATQAGVMNEFVSSRFGADSPQAAVDHASGEMFTTFIRTARGRVIRVDLDMTSDRPHRFSGFVQGRKRGCDSDGTGLTDEDRDRYDHVYWRRDGEEAARYGHDGGDFFVMRDFFNAVRSGRDPWIDVYDSAAWSSIYDCSRRSIAAGGVPVEFPDFTRGRWSDPLWRSGNMRPA